MVPCSASDLFLWNPSVRKFVTLPTPRIVTSKATNMLVLGFGFDPKRNDYKVVRIVYHPGSDQDYDVPPEVELYELSTGAWRGISGILPPYLIFRFFLPANMNGALHWIASNFRTVGEFRSLIVAFDLSDVVFREMWLPTGLASEFPLNLSIASCGEFLLLFHYYEGSDNLCCSFWVMKEYGVAQSWIQLFDINFLQGMWAVIGSRKNGELPVVTVDGKLVSYDPDGQQVKDLGIRGDAFAIIMPTSSFYVSKYVESLVLLGGAHGVLGYDAAPALLEEEEDKTGGIVHDQKR